MPVVIKRHSLLIWLICGDLLTLLVVSIIGFATHGEGISWRILTTFLPYLAAWAMTAPWLGVYHPELSRDARQTWRPALAAFLAAPMAAWLRALWLNRAIAPIFVLVLGLSAALGYGVWRLLWTVIVKRSKVYG